MSVAILLVLLCIFCQLERSADIAEDAAVGYHEFDAEEHYPEAD